MRKRLREEISRKDISERPRGGGKPRQKIKASERLARRLECFERTLIDATRSYEESKARAECRIEGFDFPALPPIPFATTSPPVLQRKLLPLPTPPRDATDINLSTPMEDTPVFEQRSGPMVDEDGSLPQPQESFEMQHKQSSQLPCPKIATAEASQVIVSFLQRLTQDGIVLQCATTPKFVKDKLLRCCNGVTQETGAMRLKEAKSEQPNFSSKVSREEVAEELKKVEPEKPSFFTSSKDQEVTEKAKEAELEKPSLLRPSQKEVVKETKEVEPKKPSQEEVAEEPNEVEPEKLPSLKSSRDAEEVDADESTCRKDFLVLSRIVFESDVEDDDGLKQLWDAMEISLACMNETKNSRVEADENQNDGCIHEFYKRDDMGLVCCKCGLIGQDAEFIFNYVWGERPSKRHSGKEPVVEKWASAPAIQEPPDELSSLPACKQSIKPLVLHAQYKDKLRMHQQEGLKFLEHNLVQDEPSGCILAHAPGTGKSFTIIAFLQSFQTVYPDEKPLIVAPKGMLSVWAREFQKWKVDDDITIFNLQEAKSVEGEEYDNPDAMGHQLKRHRQLQMLRQWKVQKSVLMAGYSAFSTLTGDKDAAVFPEIKKLLLEAPGILILDEGHFPRNKKAQITQSLSQVRTKRRVLLSGTLFQNNFDELYNLYHLVKPDFMSSNPSCTKSLLENFMKTKACPAKGGTTPSKSPRKKSGREAVELDLFKNLGETIRSGETEEKRQAITQLRQLSETFVHWYKGQILADLPGLFDLTLFLQMTKKQQELLSSFPSKAEKHLDFFTKSMRVCIHPVLLKADSDVANGGDMQWNDSEEDPTSSTKIMFILDLLQLAARMKEKVVLFSKYLDPFYLLERMLKKAWGWHLNREILKIEGRTSLEERESTIDRFNEDTKAKILFASIKTCGEGVSLIGASRIVLLDVQWNPMVSRQAVSRAFRIGQKKKVFVYRLVGVGTKEEEAHFRASEKEWLAKQIFEGCNDEDYAMYCQEVIPQEVDMYFESRHLGENVSKCLRYHFV